MTVLGAKFASATAIDVLNGTEQALRVSSDARGTQIDGVVLRDYPLVLRLTP